jgi:serine/threonine-protein kinase
MIGETISHYKIMEKLGEGGMGAVYRANDTRLDRAVALKFLLSRVVGDRSDRARFIREAKSAASLNHPNICTVHAIEENEGVVFIAMEFVEGQDLRTGLRDGPLDAGDALDIARQVAYGLACAHGKGIVHRDIKPANIMVTPTGLVKIMDFGLARAPGAAQLTVTGTTVGTVAYMSPEQARGDKVDHRTDLWSLGAVLHEMLTGRRPFAGGNDQATIYAILNNVPAPLASSRSLIPSGAAAIISRALAKDPAERYQSAAEMASDLDIPRPKLTAKTAMISTAQPDDRPSIAILPFDNMSPDPDSDFFGDGLSEDLAMALSKLPKLRVAARTSAFKCRGKDLDAREIGAQLGVGAILEGSVRKAGNRLRVTAKLIDTSDGFQLWSERYDRKMEDVFAVQDDIASAIVDQLSVRFDTGRPKQINHRPTDNLDAYALYLKGLHYWNSLTPEGLAKSRECYEGAVMIDPDYALAHAALSMWHQSVAFWADADPAEAFAKSREEALRALEIDDSVALAHNCLGIILCMYDWRWDEAEVEFRRALECDPSSAFGHLNYSFHLSGLGRHDEAIREVGIAQRLDPLSTVVNTWAASRLLAAGRTDDGLAVLEDVTARDPDAWQPHLWLSEALLYAGSRKRATTHAERAAELAGHLAVTKAFLASAYYLEGRRSEGDTVLRELEDRAQKSYVSPVLLARINIARGGIDEAVGYAERAFQEHDHWLQGVPSFAPELRFREPRLASILQRTGLPVSDERAAGTPSGSSGFESVAERADEHAPGRATAATPPQTTAPACDQEAPGASIAVMPFADMSPDKDQEYFCDGMAEEIINALTAISGLRVIARTSAFAFKDKNEDIREIGRRLDVSSILEGSVRKAGDRLRITAQLINVSDGSHVWSERYDRVLEDVFAVQDEIAGAILNRLKVEMSAGEEERLAESRRVNAEAHDLYLRGKHVLNRGLITLLRDRSRVDKAIEYFTRATEIDPECALAYAGLADVYSALCRWITPVGHCEKAREAAETALRLDDGLAEAHVAMGRVAEAVDLDWKRARKEHERAVELNPGSAAAHRGASGYFTWAAEYERAIEHADAALEFDPLDYGTRLIAVFAYWTSRRHPDEAIRVTEEALELFPDDDTFREFLLLGKVAAGIDVVGSVEELVEGWPTAASTGVACAIAGRRADARRILELQDEKHAGMATYGKARIYAALGEKEKALEMLERCWEEEPRFFLQLNSDPELDCLRGEQRFKGLLQRSSIPMGELAYLSD